MISFNHKYFLLKGHSEVIESILTCSVSVCFFGSMQPNCKMTSVCPNSMPYWCSDRLFHKNIVNDPPGDPAASLFILAPSGISFPLNAPTLILLRVARVLSAMRRLTHSKWHENDVPVQHCTEQLFSWANLSSFRSFTLYSNLYSAHHSTEVEWGRPSRGSTGP